MLLDGTSLNIYNSYYAKQERHSTPQLRRKLSVQSRRKCVMSPKIHERKKKNGVVFQEVDQEVSTTKDKSINSLMDGVSRYQQYEFTNKAWRGTISGDGDTVQSGDYWDRVSRCPRDVV
jgi:hypothetical protein